MEQFNVEFELVKDTKNTYRYAEIGSLYVQKHTIGEEPPEHLKVTVEVV